MKITEVITEAPLTDYVPMHMDQGRRFNPVDRRLVTHPTTQTKAIRFFNQSPFKFRLFFNGAPGLRKYQESGAYSPEDIKNIFPQEADKILNNYQDSINVIFVGNFGADKVIMTPWIMAHRLGHAIQVTTRNEGTNTWTDAETYFFKQINYILQNFYNLPIQYENLSSVIWGYRPQYTALFNKIGTQKSSRENKINRPYEFFYELFAQYIKDGKVTLNPFPSVLGYGKRAWGTPSRYLVMRNDLRNIESRQELSDDIAINLAAHFREALNSAVGKIYIM